jgi:hypothetical protein
MATPWPSLYDLGIEVLDIEHRNATQPGGHYLYNTSGSCPCLNHVG